MSILQYQKSTLKILDFLLRKADKGFIIEELIKTLKIGRTTGFQSIKELEKASFIKIEEKGKQKIIGLVPSKRNLSMRFFFDSFFWQSLPKEIRLVLGAFTQEIDQPVCLVLFGGVFFKIKKESDLDILVISREESVNKELLKIREKIELITERTINLHFTKEPELEILLKGVCLYGYDLYLGILERNLNKARIRAKNKFKEVLKWNKTMFEHLNKKEFPEFLDKLITELAFLYAFSLNRSELSKGEAKEIFFGSYKKNLAELDKTKDNFKKFKLINQIITELGEKIV